MSTENRRINWLVWIPFGIVAIPVGIGFVRQEVATWKLALAYERSLGGDIETAVRYGEEASRWAPQDIDLKKRRLIWLLEANRAQEAVKLADELRAIAAEDFRSSPTVAAMSEFATSLNNAAYARGMAKRDLRRAKALIDEALLLPLVLDEYSRATFLDTRGYVAMLLRDDETARADLDLAVRLVDRPFGLMLSSVRHDNQLNVDPRPASRRETELRHGVASVYQHRSELNQRLGEVERAAKDAARAKEIMEDGD
jgi:tetratricopeptide (TPR) repeat protein